MRRNLLVFVLFLFIITVYAEPKVPKYFYGDSEYKEDEYSYISNDFMYCYEIKAVSVSSSNFKYSIKFSKRSFVFNTSMTLDIAFKTEKQLDTFIDKIHLSDIENEFNRIRKQMIMNDAIPNPNHLDFKDEYFDYKHRPTNIYYQIDGSKLL